MCQVRTKPRYPIRLTLWMIRRVQLLEIRKHTCRVSVIEISYTYRCIYKQIQGKLKQLIYSNLQTNKQM